jgi:hypothetical protein
MPVGQKGGGETQKISGGAVGQNPLLLHGGINPKFKAPRPTAMAMYVADKI